MSVQEEIRGSGPEAEETAELLELMMEKTVQEEVEVALGRMDDRRNRRELEMVSERIAERLLEPVFDSLEDGNKSDDETIKTLFGFERR